MMRWTAFHQVGANCRPWPPTYWHSTLRTSRYTTCGGQSSWVENPDEMKTG